MPELSVVTYNIHHGIGINNRLDLQSIYRVLLDLDADIIALQEVDIGRPQTRQINQADVLAKKLGMFRVFGPVRVYPQGSYGNAVLSRFPILQTANHLLPDKHDERFCLETVIKAGEIQLKVLNTHLGLSQPVRYRQVKDCILPLINPSEPALLTGDFNAPPTRPEIQLLSDLLCDTFTVNSGPNIFTFQALQPYARIDYIFINQSIQPVDYLIYDSPASDHFPVRTTIEL